jgi:hypothetical protein
MASQTVAPPCTPGETERVSSSARSNRSEHGEAELPTWDARILALVEPGIDAASIVENLKRTPAERLARLQQMLAFLEHAKRDGHPETP